MTTTYVNALVINGTEFFASTPGGRVFVSTNSGGEWSQVSDGLPGNDVHALALSGTNLLAGTAGSGVWKRPVSEMITSVERPMSNFPKQYTLQQNYPNPFNPSTVISYQLPVAGSVSLVVYDLLGREASVLVNEKKDAGVHEVMFDGSGLSSGVYFYRIEAGSYVETRKLILLR